MILIILRNHPILDDFNNFKKSTIKAEIIIIICDNRKVDNRISGDVLLSGTPNTTIKSIITKLL